jgi:hypothetical protein
MKRPRLLHLVIEAALGAGWRLEVRLRSLEWASCSKAWELRFLQLRWRSPHRFT